MHFLVLTNNLHTVHRTNLLVKYADDTYLIIPGANSSLIPDELNNITQWASSNNLKLNSSKSYEMIIHHPSKKLTSVPPLHENITRTHQLTVLGVTFNNTLSFSQHMQNLNAKAATLCSQNAKATQFAREGTVGGDAGDTYLAHSANLPEGLYIVPMFFRYLKKNF